MAKFIKIGDKQYINMDQITYIDFDPRVKTRYYELPCISLSIHTSDDKCYCFSDREDDLKAIRRIIDDIRYHNEQTDQPPSFWNLIGDIDEWLDKKENE